MSSAPTDADLPPPPPASEGEPSEAPGERGLRERLEGLVPEIVRKTFYAGLGAVFSTEEGIRKLAHDLPMPKEVATSLLSSADGVKDEVLRVVGRELSDFLGKLNVSQELAKLLTQLSFEIKTEVRFIPNDQAVGGVKPDIKNKMALKRNKRDSKGDSGRPRRDDEGHAGAGDDDDGEP
jgi:hypothetical protein